ncbi:MAG: hypothetical protein JG765_205 [Cereibacter sp.]|jgi:hypothetical protein|nr:hypothetical protein [Cereibacter sp.]
MTGIPAELKGIPFPVILILYMSESFRPKAAPNWLPRQGMELPVRARA